MPTRASKKPDAATRRWTRGPADEAAVRNGCRFDEERGRFVVEWIERYCRLYEGEWAGQPLKLTDWQLDATMRLFGWVRHSGKWGREVRRFRQASIWVAKKNKKTPTAAAWALYLLCGDGEQGQKVFLGAKDGDQVRKNLARHVVEMLDQSPELLAECTHNKTTSQITHAPTRSTMLILSSSNERTKQSKEGINGSVVIDETHVVDRDFMGVISRAGISRAEPLQIEVSTAGNDPDGYGAERFSYALEVQEGKRVDQELFAAVYAAPQDLTDADLAKDPLKYGRLANPALGHTVDQEEFLADYHKSKASPRGLAEFKQYRLNVWQLAANPWLSGADWAACRRAYTLGDLKGRPCYAGLDLSRTQDMCALVLCFPWPEEEAYRLWPYFWLPKQVAEEKDHLAPFLQWANGGHLTLTPGNVVDYGWIKSEFRELVKLVTVRKLVYDQTYANEVTQSLEQGEQAADGRVIAEGTGVEREPFPQNIMAYTLPSKEWERLVISGKLHHPGHPILDWQAGHVKVITDRNENIRPVKPGPKSIKKIDGIAAGVMALGASLAEPVYAGAGGVEFW